MSSDTVRLAIVDSDEGYQAARGHYPDGVLCIAHRSIGLARWEIYAYVRDTGIPPAVTLPPLGLWRFVDWAPCSINGRIFAPAWAWIEQETDNGKSKKHKRTSSRTHQDTDAQLFAPEQD